MNPTDWLLIAMYTVVAVATGASAFVEYRRASDTDDQKFYARMTLMSPVWPLPLAGFFVWSLAKLLMSVPGALLWVPRLWRAAFSKEPS